MCISDIGIIELSGMTFHAFHGCLPEEKTRGNEFVVDVQAKTSIAKSAASDRLEDTVDMKAVYDVVRLQMENSSELLECVAGRIAEAICSTFPSILGARVTVSKKCPPVGGECAWSRVSVTIKDF